MRWGVITIDRCYLRFIVFVIVIQYYTSAVITWSIQRLCMLFLRITWCMLLPFNTSEKAMKRTSTISRLVEFGLRLIGMWPDSAYPNFYWSMYMTMLGLYQYFQYSYIVTHFDTSNLSILTDCLGLALANTSAFLKLFFLRWNRR